MTTRRLSPREREYTGLKAEQAEYGLRCEYADIGLATDPDVDDILRAYAVEQKIEQLEFDKRIERLV